MGLDMKLIPFRDLKTVLAENRGIVLMIGRGNRLIDCGRRWVCGRLDGRRSQKTLGNPLHAYQPWRLWQ
jgi:hypothetical protein